MTRTLLWLTAILMQFSHLTAQIELRFEENYSLNHEECISAYATLADEYLKCELREIGPSDCGRPIHLFTAGTMDDSLPTLLINNAIHPGESCGVEASLLLIRSLLQEDSPVLDRLNIAIIPMYNVGGSLNRGCCTRANQDGPSEQGFRGNAQYLDLNRDFIKADSRNAQTFHKIFQELRPAVLVDTHTSNGADYPYTMTLIHSQSDMIDPHLANSYSQSMVPELFERMEEHYPMSPYMNLIGKTPEDGIVQFPDWPRYSTGYAGLFNCYGFTTEAHMLKPFRDRVLATYHFLNELAQYCAEHSDELIKNKAKADRNTIGLESMFLDFQLDTLAKDSILFKGFKAQIVESEVTGLQRLKYDRSEIWESYIPYMKDYRGLDEVKIPDHYYVPQAWSDIITRFEVNGVKMQPLPADTIIEVDAYIIESYETSDKPYEGHYTHHKVQTRVEKQQVQFFKGDLIVPTRQLAKRYIVNTLEPRAKDSFFNWGFVDAVLQQKEWFSPYVFEDMALELLENDDDLRRRFQVKKEDEEFASNMWEQLIFIYRNSDYYEPGHMRYPIFRSLSN